MVTDRQESDAIDRCIGYRCFPRDRSDRNCPRRKVGIALFASLHSRLPSRRRRRPIVAAPERFRFLRWYATLSLVCIASVAVGGGVFLSHFLKEHMLQRDAVVSMEFINSIVRAEKSWSSFEAAARTSTGDHAQVLETFFNHVSRLPGVVRANVYADDRTLLWSSNRQLIGHRFGENADLDEALAGRIALDWGVVGRQDKEEHIGFQLQSQGTRFVEVYLPIWDRDRAGVLGVVEIYKLPKQLFEAIDEVTRYIWTSGVVGGLLVYATLLWVVSRASNMVREQESRLVEAETYAAIGEMASAVAHGIRNPLNAIRSSAEVARLDQPGAVAEESLADIIAQVDRADRWVGDLVAFSRSGATSDTELAGESVDIARTIAAILVEQADVIVRQGITVADDLADLPPIFANAQQLKQALAIIVTNAVEAMPNGGTLSLSGRVLPATREVEVAIADTGAGLPPALAARVFRPFFSTKPNGTGIGLALAQRIVGRATGTMRFTSREGSGSKMTVTLPQTGEPPIALES